MEIHERLHILRKNLNLTQIQMAQRLGFKGSSGYSMIETGNNTLGEDKIIILETSFNVNREWLLTGSGEMINSEYSSKQIINSQNIEPMTLETLNRMLAIIEKQQDDIHLANLNVRQAQENQANLISMIPGGVQSKKASGGER